MTITEAMEPVTDALAGRACFIQCYASLIHTFQD